MPTPSVLHSSDALGPDSQLWGTDPKTFAAINAEFEFTLDAAALAPTAKCTAYYGPDHPNADRRDALTQRQWGDWAWPSRRPAVWLNPPYNRLTINAWMERVAREAELGCTVYVLVAFRPETRWFRNAFASPYLHEERRALRRELFIDPRTGTYAINAKKGAKQKAGYPNVGLVFRPYRRSLPFPVPSYGLATNEVTP